MNKLADAVNQLNERSKLGWLTLFCLAWLLPGLVGHQPWKPDEAYSFGLVYHLIKGGDWLVPTLAGEPYLEKPPFYFIAAATVAKLFSSFLPTHDAARLTSGVFMATTLLFTGLAGRALWGRGQGRISVLLLIGCLGLSIRAHELITDTAQFAGFAIALYGLTISRDRAILAGLAIGTGTGIAFLSNGLLAPLIVIPTTLALPLFFRAWRCRTYLLAFVIGLIALLPWLTLWPGLLYSHSPALFSEWLWGKHWGRFFDPAKSADANHWFYLVNLPWYAWPALPIALWALWREKLTRPETQLPVTVFLVILLVLSSASDARELYALPMLLPLALLATAGVDSLRRGAANALNWFGIMTFGFFSGLLWFFWFALMTGHPASNHEHLLEMQPGYTPEFLPLTFSVALGYTLAWLILLIATQRLPRGRRAVINWCGGVTLFWSIATTICLPWIDAGKSYQSMVASLQQALPPNYNCLASTNLGEPQRAMLDYYASVVTRRTEVAGPLDCSLLLVQGSTSAPFVPTAEWRTLWEGARPGDKAERFWLFGRAP